MFFDIDDIDIKDEILRYKKGDMDRFELIVEKISTFIYNYPKVVFHVEEDECSDFYEYILLRLRSIIDSYNISQAKFTTWFTVVLRNRYLNFIREGTDLGYSVNDVSFDKFLDKGNNNSINLHMLIADDRNYNVAYKNDVIDRLIDKITTILNDKYRALFHLYYIDFLRVEDIRFLSLFFNRSISEIITGLNTIKNSIIDRYERRENILKKLIKNHHFIVYYQKSGDKNSEKNAKEKQEILLNEYRMVNCYPAYESIASFCNFPIGTVSAGVARIKSKIRGIRDELQEIVIDSLL